MQIPPRVVVAVLLALVGLLVIVVAVGLIRNQMDPQLLATTLVPAITGLLIAFGVKRGGPGGGNNGNTGGGGGQ